MGELLDERKSKEVEVAGKQMQLELRKFGQGQSKVEHQLSGQIARLTEQLETERRLRMDSEEKFGLHLSDQPVARALASLRVQAAAE